MSVKEFLKKMTGENLRRSAIMFKNGEPLVSHKFVNPLANDIVNGDSFRNHRAVFLQRTSCSKHLMIACIHQVNRGAAQGGLRCSSDYESPYDAVRDGLRLARGMSQKSALAKLNWGGGKGIITPMPTDSDAEERRRIFNEYGEFVSELNGSYVTAEDVATSPTDIGSVFETTRYVTCIDPKMGGSGNPSYKTASGVVSAIKYMVPMLQEQGRFPLGDNFSVGIQGLGNVGYNVLLELLFKFLPGKITATDISQAAIDNANRHVKSRSEFMSLECVDREHSNDILNSGADIIIPCAMGGVITEDLAMNGLRGTSMICGAANNQLASENVARILHERGIVFCPDPIVNRMGIVNCANENSGRLDPDPMIYEHYDVSVPHSIPSVLKSLYKTSVENDIDMVESAERMAEQMIAMKHPIDGDRYNSIIDQVFARYKEQQ